MQKNNLITLFVASLVIIALGCIIFFSNLIRYNDMCKNRYQKANILIKDMYEYSNFDGYGFAIDYCYIFPFDTSTYGFGVERNVFNNLNIGDTTSVMYYTKNKSSLLFKSLKEEKRDCLRIVLVSFFIIMIGIILFIISTVKYSIQVES